MTIRPDPLGAMLGLGDPGELRARLNPSLARQAAALGGAVSMVNVWTVGSCG